MDNIDETRLKWVAQEWKENAGRLAVWGLENLVNRFDVWGQYSTRSDAIGKSISVVTLPRREMRDGSDMVSYDKLERHFAGKKASDLIGLHCVSEEQTCKWFAIDLDVHEEEDAEHFAKVNFEAMQWWCEKFRSYYLDPCIMDTNGLGSFHLWVLLDNPYSLEDVFKLLSDATRDYDSFDLKRKPELFPSSAKLKRLGKWLRLPGRHHTHPHFTRVWSGEFGGKWLEGVEAIEHLLNLGKMPLPQVKPATKDDREVKDRSFYTGKSRNRSVCVDLDKVIASYDVWKEIAHIGGPIKGAKEFLEELGSKYKVIIYTARFSNERIKSSNEVANLKNLIEVWLRKNDLPFDDIFTGIGKPLASAFVDDRAVSCQPMDDPDAYEKAIDAISELV